MRRAILTIALAAVVALPAAAQQPLKLSFHDGVVSVEATSVPVRTILNEWSKLGGTKVIGADRISGAPITVKLINVTEAQALETILRSVAGYMAAPRSASAAGASRYDRILVMATSATPAPAANARPTPGNNNAMAGTQRFVPPSRIRQEQPEQDEQVEPDENPPNPPVFTFPQPGQQNGVQQGGFAPQPFGQPFNPQPFNGAAQPGQPVIINSGQAQPMIVTPGQTTTPTGTFGTPQPGMMITPPQPATTVPGQRPPGN